MNQTESKFSVPAFRKLEILKLLGEKGVVQITELVELYGVSQATVRRDLNELDKNGAICRTHGGAVLRQSTAFEQTQTEKLGMRQDEKLRIATYAASLIADGDSIFLDSGTTTLVLSNILANFKNLTVITNNMEIVSNIKLHPSSTLVVVGGIMRREYSLVVGSITEDFIRNIKVDKVFIGADAIDSCNGLYSSNFAESTLKKLIVECGRIRVVVSDSSKFSISGMVKICPINHLDFIITDSELDDQSRSNIEDTSVGLIVV